MSFVCREGDFVFSLQPSSASSFSVSFTYYRPLLTSSHYSLLRSVISLTCWSMLYKDIKLLQGEIKLCDSVVEIFSYLHERMRLLLEINRY